VKAVTGKIVKFPFDPELVVKELRDADAFPDG
jgi:hypothetical protein